MSSFMAGQLSVLIVDDEPLVARSVARYLESRGCRADLCGDGYQAVEKLIQQPFELVITDMNLPESSGEYLLDFIERENYRCQVIVMTGQSLVTNTKIAGRIPPIHYLQKPFDLDMLMEHVRAGLSDRK
jgi:DNA-binding NtrC family response regulator